MGVYVKTLDSLDYVGLTSTNSNAISLMDDCTSLAIQGTSSGVYNIQVELTATGTDFSNLTYSTGTAVTITGPAVVVIEPVPFRQLRVQGTGSTGESKAVVGTVQV